MDIKLFTADSRVHSQASSCGFRGGKGSQVQSFLRISSLFGASKNFDIVPPSLITTP